MTYRVNLSWTAAVNKTVAIEADNPEAALEAALKRCAEHVTYGNITTPSSNPPKGMDHRDGVILPDNPDCIEYYLEDELCEVI